jgi:hypothetical protein
LNNFDIEYYLLDSDDVYTSRTSPAFQKHFWTSTRLHSITPENVVPLIIIGMRTSHPT